MKHIEIGFEDIVQNIKKNRRGMLIIFLSILIIGAVCGYIDYQTYEQKLYTVEDTIVGKADLGHLNKDETYYYQAFMELKEKSGGLDAYIQYLKQVKLSGENMKKVSELETAALEELEKFKRIQEFYISEKPIICDDREAAEQFVRQKIKATELRLDETRDLVYVEQEIKLWEEYLAKVEAPDFDELQKTNSKMDLLLEEGVESINELVERFNELIAEIEAEEQYEVIFNKCLLREYRDMAGILGEFRYINAVDAVKETALSYARSIAEVDSREERFYAALTFSALLGAAFALLYGVLRNKKLCRK